MPTYDYTCKACGHKAEIYHSMTEVRRKCPQCGKNALERQIGTGGAVIFKGSGFYQTDYRSESYKKAAQAEGGTKSESKSEGKSESKAESKSESKSETKPAKSESKPTKAEKSDKPVKRAG